VVDVHRYHEISEADHPILNPLSAEQLLRIGDICSLRAGQRHLDLASGKGEMLCQYALRFGTTGVGIDIYDACITAVMVGSSSVTSSGTTARRQRYGKRSATATRLQIWPERWRVSKARSSTLSRMGRVRPAAVTPTSGRSTRRARSVRTDWRLLGA
jgi:hypothetical protein